jgi:hypothetical protein
LFLKEYVILRRAVLFIGSEPKRCQITPLEELNVHWHSDLDICRAEIHGTANESETLLHIDQQDRMRGFEVREGRMIMNRVTVNDASTAATLCLPFE